MAIPLRKRVESGLGERANREADGRPIVENQKRNRRAVRRIV